MSVRSASEPLFDAVKSRHRWLLYLGSVSVALGLLIAGFVGFDWIVNRTSHEVLAIIAAAAILFGVQLLMLSMLSGMLIVLHQEQLRYLDAQGDTGDESSR